MEMLKTTLVLKRCHQHTPPTTGITLAPWQTSRTTSNTSFPERRTLSQNATMENDSIPHHYISHIHRQNPSPNRNHQYQHHASYLDAVLRGTSFKQAGLASRRHIPVGNHYVRPVGARAAMPGASYQAQQAGKQKDPSPYSHQQKTTTNIRKVKHHAYGIHPSQNEIRRVNHFNETHKARMEADITRHQKHPPLDERLKAMEQNLTFLQESVLRITRILENDRVNTLHNRISPLPSVMRPQYNERIVKRKNSVSANPMLSSLTRQKMSYNDPEIATSMYMAKPQHYNYYKSSSRPSHSNIDTRNPFFSEGSSTRDFKTAYGRERPSTCMPPIGAGAVRWCHSPTNENQRQDDAGYGSKWMTNDCPSHRIDSTSENFWRSSPTSSRSHWNDKQFMKRTWKRGHTGTDKGRAAIFTASSGVKAAGGAPLMMPQPLPPGRNDSSTCTIKI